MPLERIAREPIRREAASKVLTLVRNTTERWQQRGAWGATLRFSYDLALHPSYRRRGLCSRAGPRGVRLVVTKRDEGVGRHDDDWSPAYGRRPGYRPIENLRPGAGHQPERHPGRVTRPATRSRATR